MFCHTHTCTPSKQPAVSEQTNFPKCNKRDTLYFTVIKSNKGMTEAVTGFQKSVSTMATQTCGGSQDSLLQGFRLAVFSLMGNS